MTLRLIRGESSGKKTMPIKLVVIGDGMVGKTSLLLAYMRNTFYDNYEPTIYETTTKDITISQYPNLVVQLTAEDTAGQEEYDNFRVLQYSSTPDVVLVCFSVDNADTLANIPHKWMTELRHYCPNVPVILVGTKVDLRLNQEAQPDSSSPTFMIDTEDARQVAAQIKAPYYIECSAKSRQNVEQLFEAAIAYAVKRKRGAKKGRRCNIL